MLCTIKKQHNKKDPGFCQSKSSWRDSGKIKCVSMHMYVIETEEKSGQW